MEYGLFFAVTHGKNRDHYMQIQFPKYGRLGLFEMCKGVQDRYLWGTGQQDLAKPYFYQRRKWRPSGIPPKHLQVCAQAAESCLYAPSVETRTNVVTD